MPIDDLRSSLRKARQSLSTPQREDAAIRCALLAHQLEPVRRARRLAAYMAYRGEMSCAPLVDWACRRGKTVLLPVVAGKQMRFAPYRPGDRMVFNRWGIPEPERHPQRWVAARVPSVVFVPLVAFDLAGNRLGQGGGYYDRAFAFRQHAVHWRRPVLIGLAYEFQRVEELTPKPTDVPLDAVITEQKTHNFHL